MQYPKRGEIYLVNLPAQPKDIKARPAIIVSLDVRNRLASDVIVVPITTTLRPSPTHVELPKAEGGLDQISMAKCEQITTLEKSFLIRGPFSGAISSIKIDEIEEAIQIAIGIVPLSMAQP
jgi:mRNA interferase MazF